MKRRKIGFFFKILILIVIVGIATCFIDYTRVLNNEEPLFAIKSYDKKTKTQTYRGLFYIVDRKITISKDESMKDSKNIIFKVLLFRLNLEARKVNEVAKLNVSYTSNKDCNVSNLIYATEDIKIYSYCLDDLTIKENNKKIEFSNYFKTNKIIELLPFYGMDDDKTTEIYIDDKSYSKDGFKVYKCNNNEDNKSLYFTDLDTRKQPDFCIFKDDDFAYTFKIENSNDKDICKVEEGLEPLPKEIFYEDENNQYAFECQMSQNIKLINYQKELNVGDALISNQVTITDLKNKGLKFETIKKEIINEE